jgi:hypothetical protein
MGVVKSLFSYFGNKKPQQTKEVSSNYGVSSGAIYSQWYTERMFDGEKTPGEMGNVINLLPDFQALRLRSYEQALKSDVVTIITGKFFKWVVGKGLDLQCQPNEEVLKSEGINADLSTFRKVSEARFKLYSSSKRSSFSGMQNLHKEVLDAFQTQFLGGDCLVVLRVVNKELKIQVIDGQEVCNPFPGDKYYEEAKNKGNEIKHGIEISEKGEHVAFYVRSRKLNDFLYEVKRIQAKNQNTGTIMAKMIYIGKHRINHLRGVPKLSPILEKVEKIDRYTEATVSSAEERAKIAYAIEHNQHSTGENPLLDKIKRSLPSIGDTTGLNSDPYALGENISKKIASTTNKQAFNMPIGSKLESLESNQEVNYKDFFDAVFIQLSAAVDVPPEVALQKYSSNYSASRAAINGWGYIVDIYRNNISEDIYKWFYSVWLELEILKGKILAPGYLQAIREGNKDVLEAYCSCRFTGVNMPHIDPLKEVNAIRRMLGDKNKGETALISHEQATESLNQGEWSENYNKYLQEIDSFDIEQTTEQNGDTSKDKEQDS